MHNHDPVNFRLLADTLNGIRVELSSCMEGMKKAIWFKEVLYVSPALYSLLQTEKGDDLENLLKSIKIIDIGTPDMDFDIGMTTSMKGLGEAR